MYFCPQCNYTFDIARSTLNKKIIENPDELIKIIKDIELSDLANYNMNFIKKDILKNKKYKKLSTEEKESIDELFENNSFDKIEFKCLDCNFRKQINTSIKLYEYSLEDDITLTYKSIEENKLLFANPIYPRTRDYTCKNINCITHKDTSNKEAVFYKDQKYKLVYICGVCHTNWG
jgi:aspartate carbamoyltransferase regulatory subunit